MALLLGFLIAFVIVGVIAGLWWLCERPDKYSASKCEQDKDPFTDEVTYGSSQKDKEFLDKKHVDFSGQYTNSGCYDCFFYYDMRDNYEITCRHKDNITIMSKYTGDFYTAIMHPSGLNHNRSCRNFRHLSGDRRKEMRRKTKSFGHWFFG